MNTTQTVRSWGKIGFFESRATPIYDDYYQQRNIPRQHEHPEVPQDFSDLCSKQVPLPPVFFSSQRPMPEHLMSKETANQRSLGSRILTAEMTSSRQIGGQSNDFERLYYIEINRSKALEEDLKCMKDVLKKAASEKDLIRTNYEEFIKKLEEEIRMLKTFETKYNMSDSQRRKAEEDLSRKIIEIRLLREQNEGIGSTALLEEMRAKIRRLNEEKLALLNSMDVYRTEINELSNRITYIQNSDQNERDNLAKMMAQMKDRNFKLESELKELFERPPEDPALISELRQKTEALAVLTEELEMLKRSHERELGTMRIDLESQRRLAMNADKELEFLRKRTQETVEKVVYATRPCEECGKKDLTIKYLSDKIASKDTPSRTITTTTNEISTVSTRELPTTTYRTISPARVVTTERVVSQPSTVYKTVSTEPCRCTGVKTLVSTTCSCNCACHKTSYIADTTSPMVSVRNVMEVSRPINTSVITRTMTYGAPLTSQVIQPTTTTSVYSPHGNANPISFATTKIDNMRASITTTNTATPNPVSYRSVNEYGTPDSNYPGTPKVYRINNDHHSTADDYNYQQNQTQVIRSRPMSAQETTTRVIKTQVNNINVPLPTQQNDYDSKINDEFTKRLELSQPATDILLPSRFTLNKESQTPKEEDLAMISNNMNRDASFDSIVNGFSFKKDSVAFCGGSYLNTSMGQNNDNTSNIFKRNSIMTAETRDQNVFRGGFNEYS